MVQSTLREVTFRCHDPGAEKVFLAGTFNSWDPTAMAMERDAAGSWHAIVRLTPGRHEYKFVIDGVWCCDSDCEGPHPGYEGQVANDCGTMNRFIEVA